MEGIGPFGASEVYLVPSATTWREQARSLQWAQTPLGVSLQPPGNRHWLLIDPGSLGTWLARLVPPVLEPVLFKLATKQDPIDLN